MSDFYGFGLPVNLAPCLGSWNVYFLLQGIYSVIFAYRDILKKCQKDPKNRDILKNFKNRDMSVQLATVCSKVIQYKYPKNRDI